MPELYELNSFEELEKVFDYAIDNNMHVGVLIEMPGFPAPELITNPHENLALKLDYYKKTYDEKLNHKHAPGIRIVGHTY